jgi:UDP-glucose 4-epimerase
VLEHKDGREYKDATAVVVGASGFIGRWVARKLVEQGARVCVIGRADIEKLGDIYRRVRPSITFNLAGYGIDPLERDEDAAYRVNADLPRIVAEAVASWKNPAWPGQHFVHVGSGAEYGDAGGDLREDGPARPTTLYGKSKWRGTMAVAEASRALGLRALTSRLFTVYGPGERAGRLLPSLLQAKRTGRPLDLSPGMQRRDFTYVEDAAEGLLRLGLAPEGCGIVNLATGRLATVRAFVETAADVLEIPPENLIFGAIPANAYEMRHESIQLECLRTMVGWVPPTSVAEGIRKTLEYSLQ